MPDDHPTTGQVLPDERLLVTKDFVEAIEKDIRTRRHIERYLGIAQHAYGTVLDCASGSGFGSYLLAKKSDVKHVHGIDADTASVEQARREFGSEKISFHALRIEEVDVPADYLVCIETIEHLDDPTVLADMCDRTGVREIIVSYPSKKSTHYNKFHRWDFVAQDIDDIFPNFITVETTDFAFDTTIVRMIRHERAVIAPKRWSIPRK